MSNCPEQEGIEVGLSFLPDPTVLVLSPPIAVVDMHAPVLHSHRHSTDGTASLDSAPCNLEPCNLEPCNLEPCNLEPCNPKPCNPKPCNPKPCEPVARERCRVFSARALAGVGLGVALASCTLTRDDFEPVIAEAEMVQPEAGPDDESPTPDPSGCTASLECPDGFECAGDVCVPSGCDVVEGNVAAGAEGVSACAIDLCSGGDCAPAACGDGAQGDGETGVDCGGPCPRCEELAGCVGDAECAPGACVEGRCAEPSCDDGLTNQDETAADCGGAICARCPLGAVCSADSDCEGGLFCASTTGACTPASCQDGEQNGSELGVDCGGGECPGCEVGAPCSIANDCASSSCVEGSCAEPSCDDAARNGSEADVDCGGSCSPCATGLACVESTDCVSSVCGDSDCADGVATCCQAPSCDDGVRNGAELAVDCGVAPCGRCEVGAPCARADQCASNVCTGGSCAELCDDEVLNGNESAADCGGSEVGCPRCGDGQTCRAGSDCASGACDAGLCVSCSDGVENGDEGGVDCGGSSLGCAACPRCAVENSIDLGGVGNLITITGDACARITAFPGYAPTLLDSYELGTFPVSFTLRQDCTAVSIPSSFDSQFDRVTLAGLGVDCPVVIDFRGTNAPLQVRWF